MRYAAHYHQCVDCAKLDGLLPIDNSQYTTTSIRDAEEEQSPPGGGRSRGSPRRAAAQGRSVRPPGGRDVDRRLRPDDARAGPGDRRPERGAQADPDRALLPGALHPGGGAGPGQDADDLQHRQAAVAPFRPHPVHARPDALGHHRHRSPRGRRRDRPAAHEVRQGADLRQHRPGRRDQPHAAQDPGGALAGDAGVQGHRRRRRLSPGKAVPGARHAEPDRAGRDLPAARGPARPLHVQGA